MASNNQTFKIALPSTKQLRPRAGTGDPCNAAAMSTLSDRVAKRGWTRKACLECHRRKIKCDMTTKNRCTSCEKLDISCSVNEYRRRRNKEKRSKIDQLESNIERMENVFEKLGLMRPGNFQPLAPLSCVPSRSTWDIPLSQAQSQIQDKGDAPWDTASESGSEHSNSAMDQSSIYPPSHLDHSKGSPVADKGFHSLLKSLASPSNLVDSTKFDSTNTLCDSHDSRNWIQDGSEDHHPHSFSPMSCLQIPDYEQPLNGVSTPNTFYPLPGIADTMVLFLEYLENFNSICPLFRPLSLLSICDEDNSITPGQADRWACINIVLALAYAMRSGSSNITQANHQISWMFMKNALQVANSLCNGPPTLWAAQGLLGISFFLLGTLHIKPCDHLITSALRISHHLLSQDLEGAPHDCEEVIEHRRIVFWIAYCLDRGFSLQFGSSRWQSDEVIDIKIPPGLSWHRFTLPSDHEKAEFDVFRSYCELSIIKGQVYELLCSANSCEQPTPGLANSVFMLEQKLREWKASIPERYRPDVQEAPSFPDSKAVILLVSLHFSYFNCLLSVHRVIDFYGSSMYMELARSYSSGLLSEDIAFLSRVMCQNAARASIKLMEYMPSDNPSFLGILLHFLVVATTELSKNIIDHPGPASRSCDIRLINQVEHFLSSVVLTAPNEGIDRVVKHCAEHRFLAESAVNGVGTLTVASAGG